MTTPVLTEDTLKALEAFLEKGTPGKWESDPVRIGVTDRMKEGIRRIWTRQKPYMSSDIIILEVETQDGDLICALQNNAAELLRGYRLGISLDKDRKP